MLPCSYYLKETIEKFNSYHSRLKFTYETNWYRKNRYSGRYLNYFSYHPFQQKIAIIKNLVNTAILLSHEKFHKENLEIIKYLLMLNNYPNNFINRHINNRIFQLKNKDKNSDFIPKNN